MTDEVLPFGDPDIFPVNMRNTYRKVNFWLDTDDEGWLEQIYDDCFPLSGTDRHKSTFKTIVINLSMRKEPLNISLHKSGYKGKHCLPDYLLPSRVSEVISYLKLNGYITYKKGYKFPKNPGISSTIEPTDKLLSEAPSSIKYHIRKEGLIIVKDFTPVHYLPEVEEARAVLWKYNKTVEPENMIYATHVDDFNLDGRFTGSAVINMPKADRKNMKVDGDDSIEIDIKNCLPFILYATKLKKKFSGDAYDITGYERELVKKAFIIILNCNTRKQAQEAIQGEINKEYRGTWTAETLMTQIEAKHADIEDYLYIRNWEGANEYRG